MVVWCASANEMQEVTSGIPVRKPFKLVHMLSCLFPFHGNQQDLLLSVPWEDRGQSPDILQVIIPVHLGKVLVSRWANPLQRILNFLPWLYDSPGKSSGTFHSLCTGSSALCQLTFCAWIREFFAKSTTIWRLPVTKSYPSPSWWIH
jgi:hypothetical protein